MKSTVAIVGIGLIGGSLGQALRRTGRYRVIGIARRPATLREAKRLGVIDVGSTHLNDVCSADIVVLATPVGRIVPLIGDMRSHLRPDTIVTDVGSIKASLMRQIHGIRFVGGHPLAGSHRTGVQAARPDLFQGATCVLVSNDEQALKPVQALWKAVGAKPIRMSAEAHDAALALTSHLPHILAHALVHVVSDRKDRATLQKLMAGSFRDMTRVASSDPEQWTQIFQANVVPIRRSIALYKRELNLLERNLRKPELKKILRKSRNFRSPLFNGI